MSFVTRIVRFGVNLVSAFVVLLLVIVFAITYVTGKTVSIINWNTFGEMATEVYIVVFIFACAILTMYYAFHEVFHHD